MAPSSKYKFINSFLSEIAEEEGKKHQASIGDLREIYKLMDKKLKGKLTTLVILRKDS